MGFDKKTGITYAGCIDDFGYVIKDEKGLNRYVSIFSSPEEQISIIKIIVTEDFIYFQGEKTLFEYSKAEKKVTQKWDHKSFWDYHIFKCNQQLFISDKELGILKIKNGKLVKVPTNIPSGEKIIFAPTINAKMVIAGTDSSHFYLFDGAVFTKLKLKDADYLKKSVPTDAIWVRQDLVIIATQKGGCVLINPVTGKTISIINYYSGLPDNEVHAIGRDKQAGIWIAHEYGLTRINYSLPLRNYTDYPGLEGNISTAITFNNNIYVGTNEGVYKLDEVRDYKEVTKYVKVKILKYEKRLRKPSRIRPEILKLRIKALTTKKHPQNQTKTGTPKPETKVKLLDKIKSKIQVKSAGNNNKTVSSPKKTDSKNKSTNRTKTEPPKYVVKKIVEEKMKAITNFELLSVKYAYKKLKNIDAKSRQFVIFKNNLLLATNKGLYQIKDTIVNVIVQEGITYVFIDKKNDRLFVSTEDKKLAIYKYEAQKWNNITVADNLPDPVFNISEDKKGFVWVSLKNNVLRYSPFLNRADTFQIRNPFSDDLHLVYLDKIYVIAGKTTYYFDDIRDEKFKPDTSLLPENENKPYRRLLHNNNQILWHFDGHKWEEITHVLKKNTNVVYLQLFKDIYKILYDQEKHSCWVITRANHLYLVDLNTKTPPLSISNVYLRNLKDDQGNTLPVNRITIKQNSGNVSFSFNCPDFLDSKSIQYSYKLNGVHDTWSVWSYDDEVVFGYLPAGKYELNVRSKNALNQISQVNKLIFKVKPPYWQEWWFYLIEFAFFGSLLWLSVWLNTSWQGNPWLTKGLTFLTIVMMIELVNTIFESYFDVDESPVQSFLLQVLLAILIFPFERILAVFLTSDPKKTILNLKDKFKRRIGLNKKKQEETMITE